MQTTSGDVLELFRGSDRAHRAFEGWRTDPARRDVHAVALGHISRHVYDIESVAIKRLQIRIKKDSAVRYAVKSKLVRPHDHNALHPLGAIDPADNRNDRARDWSPPGTFNLAFHVHLERTNGAIFTYPEFEAAAEQDDEVLGPLLWHNKRDVVAELRAKATSDEDRCRADNAVQWRLGCAYYSFFREVYVLASLREAGIDLRLHPLADALFRTDFWTTDGYSVSLRVPNAVFADSSGRGRKPPMEAFGQSVFVGAVPLTVAVPRDFGTIELPKSQTITTLIQQLRSR